MIATIYSLGYSVREDQQRLVEIMNADPRAIIIDTRKEPSSKVTGYDEKHRHELSQRWGKRYRWLGDTLGNVNYRPEDRSKGIQLVDEKAGIRTLINGLKYDHSLILLCGCQDAHTCHRTYIARKLIAKLLKDGAVPFDVSRGTVLSLLTGNEDIQFDILVQNENIALEAGDTLTAEGYRLQALEILVAEKAKVPEVWSEEAMELLKKRGTPEQLQEYENCLEWASENAQDGDPDMCEAMEHEAKKVLKQVAGAV